MRRTRCQRPIFKIRLRRLGAFQNAWAIPSSILHVLVQSLKYLHINGRTMPVSCAASYIINFAGIEYKICRCTRPRLCAVLTTSGSWRLSALVLTPRREIPLMDSIKHPAFHSFVTGFPPRYPKADLSQNLSKSWLVPQGRELIWVCCQVLSCLRGSFWCQINLFHYLGVLHDYIGLKKGGGVLTKEGTKRRYEEEVGGGRGG